MTEVKVHFFIHSRNSLNYIGEFREIFEATMPCGQNSEFSTLNVVAVLTIRLDGVSTYEISLELESAYCDSVAGIIY